MVHKHKYKLISYTSLVAYFTCECFKKVQRALTLDETAVVQAYWETQEANTDVIHAVCHEWYDIQSKYVESGRYIGLMDEAEKFAKKYPSDTRLSGIDDYMHMSGMILYIYHQSPHSFFGTSVYVMTQTQKPFEFFMYPGHVAQSEKALNLAIELAEAPRNEIIPPKFTYKTDE